MLIGELSIKAGLSKDTIRFYEKQGLLVVQPNERRQNNYKEYSMDNLDRLLQIKRIKEFGFTLNETAWLLEMMAAKEASCKKVSGHIAVKVSVIDKKMAELARLKSMLLQLLNTCSQAEGSAENCPSLASVNKK